jgi:hypothetical protein
MALDLTGLGSLVDFGSKLIDRLIPDPAQRDAAKLELLKAQQAGEFKELDSRMAAINAEANSADPWTSRARPTFLYVFYVLILALVLVAPILGVFFPAQMQAFFANVGAGFKAIPGELWATFTAGYIGYAGFRTVEKIKGAA